MSTQTRTSTSRPLVPATRNERRADQALNAVIVGSDCEFRLAGSDGLATDVSDLLANVRHLCDRFELDFAQLDRRAAAAHSTDLGQARRVRRKTGRTLSRKGARAGSAARKTDRPDAERRGTYIAPDGEPYRWRAVLAVHPIGPFTIVEYRPRRSVNVAPAEHDSSPKFHSYILGQDTNHSHSSLEAALAHCVAYTYEGVNTRADRYFLRAIGAETPTSTNVPMTKPSKDDVKRARARRDGRRSRRQSSPSGRDNTGSAKRPATGRGPAAR